MATNSTSRERRDWTLIIFLLPIGIILMLVAGQIAIRLVPSWRVDGGMQSSLDPETAAKSQPGQVQPVSFDILTPMGWLESFLTPGPGSAGDGIIFPPFIILEPSITPSITPTATDTPVSPTVSPTTVTPTATTPTPTKKPNETPTAPTTCTDPAATNFGGPLPCTYPPTTCTDPLATNFGGPLPCTYPPTTCEDPLATNFGGPLPCTYPPTTCEDPLANNEGGPLPCIYPSPSALEGSEVTPVPSNITVGTPNGVAGNIPNGSYIIINLSATPIVVTSPTDTNYDLVYYEVWTGGGIDMDSVIISISMNNTDYYVVFHWGDGNPDNNSNVGDVAGSENDNQSIDDSELYGGSQPTGILIDVDNASSNPPPGDYYWVAIQAPTAPVADSEAHVDSIDVVDVTPSP